MLSHPVRTVYGIGVWVCAFLCIAVAVAAPVAPAGPTKTPDSPAKNPPSIPKRAAEPKEAELDAEIDLPKLLNRDLVFPMATVVTDGIWSVPPGEGRMIVRIPFVLTKQSTAVVASGATVKVRGGRFVCWQLFDPKEEAAKTIPLPVAGAIINPEGTDGLPVNVPRMTRAVQIDPDGTISWKMDRSISGASITEAAAPSPYVLKLSPAAINKLNPGTSPRIVKNAGESPQDFIKRKQPLEEEFRKKLAVFNDAKRQLLHLPDEFKGPAPATLWAVFETRSNVKSIELDGPAPLPWDFPLDVLLQLQRVIAGGNEVATPLGAPGLTFSTAPVESNLEKVLSDPKVHPMSLRLIAHAITASTFLEKMEEDDGKYKVIEKVLAGRDSVATAEIMKYLAVRPSKASASLMKKAITAGLLDAKAQLSSILGMLDSVEKNPSGGVDNAVLTINQYLADPKGPSPREALAPLFALAKKNVSLAPAITKALRVDATAARRDEVIVSIIESAVSDPAAAAVLDAKLLGSDDPTLQERTLHLLAQAVRPKMDLASFADVDGKPIALVTPQTKLVAIEFWTNASANAASGTPAMARIQKGLAAQGVAQLGINIDKERSDFDLAMKDLKFTWPQVWEGKLAEGKLQKQWAVSAAPMAFVLAANGQVLWRGEPQRLEAAVVDLLAAGPAALVPAVTDAGPKPVLIDDVPINDVQDNIFRLLTDSKLRNLAWGALRSMRMAPAASNASADRARWPLTIVDLAVAQSPTPVASARFIAKHSAPNVAEALVQLVIRAEADASTHAAKSLLGSGLPLDQVLAALTSESDRHSFGIRFYENISKEAPYSVGLLRDKSDSTRVLAWFGKQIAGGTLPEPAKWVRAYGAADRVAELIVASDEDLAMGAIGTLVAAVGGDSGDVQDAGQKLRANKNATIPEAAKIWAPISKEIFAKKLKGSSTTYQLTFRTGDVSKEGDVAWGARQVAGPVAMKVEGGNVTINKATATIAADDSLTLHLKPADVAPLAAALAAFIPDAKDKLVVIQPLGPTAWIAEYNLADGRRVELLFEAKK